MSSDKETVILRADANTSIGTGHLMRCLALGQALRARHWNVIFITACQIKLILLRLLKEDFQVITLEKPYPRLDDWQIMSRILLKNDAAWVVLDGYYFDSEYQLRIKEGDCRLLVIDDMNHLDHYYVDILLNQNLNADQLIYSCEPYAHLLLGTRYVLLRSEFLDWKNWQRETPEIARRVLVTLGGGDPHNVTLQVVNALKILDISDMEVKVIAGPSYPHIETLKQALPRTPSNMTLVPDTENMAQLMAWADVAVSAGGSTCWEMCFMKLPLATIILADNQKNISEALETIGIGISCGWYHGLDEKSLAKRFEHLIYDKDRRARMSERAGQLVDELGIKRTIDIMATIA